MSRSGYSDDYEYMGLYRATVDRSIRGKRGQAFLREMAAAMDAMPVKRLIAGEIENDSGEVCAIGTVCKARGMDASKIDYDEPESVGRAVGISRALAAEIEFENDERPSWGYWTGRTETPEERWVRMRKWVEENIQKQESL